MELEQRVATLEQKVAALGAQPSMPTQNTPQQGMFSNFKLPFTGGSRRKSRQSKKSKKSRKSRR